MQEGSEHALVQQLLDSQAPIIHVLGQPGAGKTTTLQYLLLQFLSRGSSCLIIEGARAYWQMAYHWKGAMYNPGNASTPWFNPVWTQGCSEQRSLFPHRQDTFLAWINTLLDPLSTQQQVVLRAASRRAMRWAGICPEDPSTWNHRAPTLVDIYRALFEEPGDRALGTANPAQVARQVAAELEDYAVGGLAPYCNRAPGFVWGKSALAHLDLMDVPVVVQLAYTYQAVHSLVEYMASPRVVVADHLGWYDQRSKAVWGQILRQQVRENTLYFSAPPLLPSAHPMREDAQHFEAALLFRVSPQDLPLLECWQLSPRERERILHLERGECLFISPCHRNFHKIEPPAEWLHHFAALPRKGDAF